MSQCLLSIVCLSAMLSASVASADPERHSDVAFQKTLSVVTDGADRYIAFSATTSDRDDRLFFGSAQKLHRVPFQGWSREADRAFTFSIRDPRHKSASGQASFEMKDGRYVVKCDEESTEFTPLSPEKSERFLAEATFLEAPEVRVPHFLGRDEFGIYYYVDRGLAWTRKAVDGGGFRYKKSLRKDFRLHRGERGDMHRLKMRNVVSDSAGEIFSSHKGTLRLILSNDEALRRSTWIHKKERLPLVGLPILRNKDLIFEDLGVYTSQPLHMPCDL